jgi:hypothetical protein
MFETGHFATLWKSMALKLGLRSEFIASDWRTGAVALTYFACLSSQASILMTSASWALMISSASLRFAGSLPYWNCARHRVDRGGRVRPHGSVALWFIGAAYWRVLSVGACVHLCASGASLHVSALAMLGRLRE